MSKLNWKRFALYALIAAAAVLLIVYIRVPIDLARLALRAATPLLLGCVLAYILNLLLVRYESVWFPHSSARFVVRTRRAVCVLLSVITLLLILVAVVLLVLPGLRESVEMIVTDLSLALTFLLDWLGQHADEFPSFQDWLVSLENLNWSDLIQKAMDFLAQGTTGIFQTTVGILTAVANGLITLLLGFIFALYLLFGKERLAGQFHRLAAILIRPRARKWLYYVLETLHRSFSSFIVGQCTEAVILGALCALGMSILSIPYAVVVGVVVGVTALIPVAGAYIGGIIGFFLVVMVSPMKALIFLIFLVLLQQVEGNVIYPRVVGSSVGLPGIWVLAVVIVGGGLMGVGGMLLGVPLASAVYRMLSDFVHRREAAAAAESVPAPGPDDPSAPSEE